ncbi:MAG: hypothetical protein NTY66_03170 [Candidatus Vogelbacteria bacterium]|nr:hypothetical protein [Candidatus Vogelbacteria bacterium]
MPRKVDKLSPQVFGWSNELEGQINRLIKQDLGQEASVVLARRLQSLLAGDIQGKINFHPRSLELIMRAVVAALEGHGERDPAYIATKIDLGVSGLFKDLRITQ